MRSEKSIVVANIRGGLYPEVDCYKMLMSMTADYDDDEENFQ